jgi:hypothetical protein
VKVYLRKQLRALVPHGEEAEELIQSLKPNELVRAEITRPRNLGQHRLYWAMCRLVAMNHDELKDAEAVHQAIKILSGHCDVVQIKGMMVKIPRSISFGKMEQSEFERFFRSAKDTVINDLLPGVSLRDIEEELLRMAT